MAEKKYYWLKLEKDFFKQKEIKKLRKVAGGDTLTVIYLKMALLSLENNGFLLFEGLENDISSELSLELDEEVENIKLVIAFLQNHNMIETKDSDFYLTRIPEMTGKETGAAKRMRIHRVKNPLECNNVTRVLQSVTECYTEKEKDKEKDKEKYKEKDKEKDMYTRCIQDVYSLETQVRLGKDSIVKSKGTVDFINETVVTEREIHTKHFHLVLYSDDYEKLCTTYSKQVVEDMIEKILSYSKDYLKKYSSFYRILNNWIKDKKTESNVIKNNDSNDSKVYKELGVGYELIKLTEEEIKLLKMKLGREKTTSYIDRINEYMKQKNIIYDNQYKTILEWWVKDCGR